MEFRFCISVICFRWPRGMILLWKNVTFICRYAEAHPCPNLVVIMSLLYNGILRCHSFSGKSSAHTLDSMSCRNLKNTFKMYSPHWFGYWFFSSSSSSLLLVFMSKQFSRHVFMLHIINLHVRMVIQVVFQQLNDVTSCHVSAAVRLFAFLAHQIWTLNSTHRVRNIRN